MLDVAPVGQDQPSDAGGRQLVGHDATKSAHTRDQNRGVLQLLLSRLAKPGDIELPLVCCELFLSQGDGWVTHQSTSRNWG